MRNRASTPPRNESEFINGGTAGVDDGPQTTSGSVIKTKLSKAKPVSISFTEENLEAIDRHIKNEIMSGNSRVNRSDIVRAAILGLDKFSQTEIAEFIEKVKLK